MNKIKILYDVFKTMKGKEIFKGTVKVDLVKGEDKLVDFTNEFSTNILSGDTKIKINSEINIDEKKSKHEISSEFNSKDCRHHKFHKGFHMGHHRGEDHCTGASGIKGKISKITFMLNVLNNLKLEETDGKTVISLDLKEIIKEIKNEKQEFYKELHEKIRAKHGKVFDEENMDEQHKLHHGFMKEILHSEYKDAVVNIYVSNNNEVEKIEVSANGEKKFNALVNLVW